MKKQGLVIMNDFTPMIAVQQPSPFAFFFSFCSGIFNMKHLITAVIFICSTTVHAQQTNAAVDTGYEKVLKDRTAKIVNTLDIKDAGLYNKVQQQLVNQYIALNAIQNDTKAAITNIKAQQQDKAAADAAIKNANDKKAIALKDLHNKFIAALKTSLTDDQVEKIKDGMTYRVLPITWAAYLDMLPKLTQQQKDTMYTWLVEARELAMDEGTSDAKHAVFGKYKGRINNYLSSQGYDMKKEGEDWAKRKQAEKEKQPNQNQPE
ncbi:MAG: DUF3826 domain-containing protein [Bacteroidetes bacterium]|nr:DUF3826 domain-containing protein [Bacteroidota bacterium]